MCREVVSMWGYVGMWLSGVMVGGLCVLVCGCVSVGYVGVRACGVWVCECVQV